MGYTGVTDETFRYLRDLRDNNKRDWFESNRARYEDAFKQVGLELIDALAAKMAALSPPLRAEARINGSLRRINRDVRFSRDKSPYNPRIHLTFWTGVHPNRSPGMHFVILPDGIGYGAGGWGYEGAELDAIRARISDPADRSTLLAAMNSARAIGCEFGEPELKNLPKGYEADHKWEHLLRRKSFVMRTRQDLPRPEWLATSGAVDKMIDLTRACMPFIGWLAHR